MSREERVGQRFVLVSMMIEGIYPALVHVGSLAFPPIWFAAMCTMLSAIVHCALVIYRGRWNFTWKLFWPWVGMTLFVPVIPAIFIFLGTRLSTGINTTLLLQTELLAAIIVFSFIIREKLPLRQYVGAAFVLIGTLLVLFQGTLELRTGDLLILLGVSFYPWGNICAKKLLKTLDPFQTMFLRASLGGILLLLVSCIVEGSPFVPLSMQGPFWIIPTYALVVLVGSKLLWYAGLRYLPILKATSMIVAFPIVGFFVAAVFLHEIPTMFQIAGFVSTVCGLFLLTRV